MHAGAGVGVGAGVGSGVGQTPQKFKLGLWSNTLCTWGTSTHSSTKLSVLPVKETHRVTPSSLRPQGMTDPVEHPRRGSCVGALLGLTVGSAVGGSVGLSVG